MTLGHISVSYDAIMRGTRDMVFALAVFAGLVSVSQCGTGCALFKDVQAPNAKEQNYTAAIMGCAATAKTKAEDHRCRVRVNHDFGLCDGNPAQLPGDCEMRLGE